MIELDLRLTKGMRIAEQPGKLRTISAILAHSGDSWYWLIGWALVWWLGTDYWKVRALILIFAILITAGIVFVVKRLVPRRRPEGEWGKFYRMTDPGSFPSGHTVRAFMLAMVMLGLGPLWLGLVILIWAPLVGLARVAMGVHYLSDVLAGMVLGLLIGGVLLMVI
ncbi:MAG TPA: phosphatase PAP2 family protein [Anaerolineales bacterium]|nr:phosphatase PAP2 family protein [Anaerolineales bacterium]